LVKSLESTARGNSLRTKENNSGRNNFNDSQILIDKNGRKSLKSLENDKIQSKSRVKEVLCVNRLMDASTKTISAHIW
jgi:hypothetical protein